MKLSDLVAKLESAKAEYGDIEVLEWPYDTRGVVLPVAIVDSGEVDVITKDRI